MGVTTDRLVLTDQLWEQFLDSLKVSERKVQTIRLYRKCMEELYDFLPEGKEITGDTLEEWKRCMKDCGYSESTINMRMTAANGLLKYCGMKGCTASHEHILREGEMPELTREEYLQLLSTALRLGYEQEYLLIKLFASVDIRIQELQYLTVESCREGMVYFPDGRSCLVPPCFGREVMEFADRRGIASGAVFVTRSGNPLDRSNIARAIRQLAHRAGMDPEKCCPRALHRIYRRMQEELKRVILPIYLKTYDNLLSTEQALVEGWKRKPLSVRTGETNV